jgi:hypothetical protein
MNESQVSEVVASIFDHHEVNYEQEHDIIPDDNYTMLADYILPEFNIAIELKAGRNIRNILTGISQCFYYSSHGFNSMLISPHYPHKTAEIIEGFYLPHATVDVDTRELKLPIKYAQQYSKPFIKPFSFSDDVEIIDILKKYDEEENCISISEDSKYVCISVTETKQLEWEEKVNLSMTVRGQL